MPNVPEAIDDERGEALRRGTRQQYESDWVLIPAEVGSSGKNTREFLHNFGEVPWVVHVIRSRVDDVGKMPVTAVEGTDITVTLIDSDSTRGTETTTVTVQNDLTEDMYFKVRAM